MHFTKLGLIEPLVKAVRSEGYVTPTPIQQQAIPHVLAGKDLMGCAQTGTGKTAAFALPIIQLLANRLPATAAPTPPAAPPHGGHAGPHASARGPNHHAPIRATGPERPIRALIIGPTRELAAQIGESFRSYGRNTTLRHTVIFGGVGQGPQAHALREGVDVLVATPGRLLDLLNQRLLTLGKVEILVLDEADRMLDMGFIHDIRKIIAQMPAKRQTLLFSATMPREIRTLANTVLHQPIEVRVATESPAADTVQQTLYHVEKPVKPQLLEHLLRDPNVTRALVFTRTKHGADKVVRALNHADLAAEAIHSNKSQNARMRALDNFKRGKILALIASDIAARGLDVDDISHVFNYDLPAEPETYVHRIGRTGRAGAQGRAVSFCSSDQRDLLKAVERLLGKAIPVKQHSFKTPPGALIAPAAAPAAHRQGHASGGSQHAPRGQHGQSQSSHSGGQPQGQRHDHRGGSKPADPHRRQEARPQGSSPAGQDQQGKQNPNAPTPPSRFRGRRRPRRW